MTTIQRIKELLELDKVSISFKEAVLDNGVKVVTEGEFVVGAPVFVIDDAGVQTPAPNGDHYLPELKLTISVADGVITAVTEDLAEEVSTDESLEILPEERQSIIDEVMAAIIPMLSELSAKIDELESGMNNGEMLSDIESLKTQVDSFSKLPGGVSKTVIDEPTKKNRESLENKLEKFKRIIKG